MCGGTLVARASRTRNSVKLGFLLLLFSIAHLPLLRHADAKILQGDLITREVTTRTESILRNIKTESQVVSAGPSIHPSARLLHGQYYCATCTSKKFPSAVHEKRPSARINVRVIILKRHYHFSFHFQIGRIVLTFYHLRRRKD